MRQCVFCEGMKDKWPDFFFEDLSGLFVGMWDQYPARPGHAILIPKRHVRYFGDLTEIELAKIAQAVVDLKSQVRQTDLNAVYKSMMARVGEKSAEFIKQAQTLLSEMGNRQPDAFNDGVNDGAAAGQTVPHLHWHVIPRWTGDDPDPRGGIRHMFPGMGNYRKGLQK